MGAVNAEQAVFTQEKRENKMRQIGTALAW
jgi:hypothetical protein